MPVWFEHPHLALALVFVAAGFWVLSKGADALVAGAVKLAQRLSLSPAMIGATVVAFGTSLPEVVVSLTANLKALRLGPGPESDGLAAIAIGNVVGSNIFNIGFILGLAVVIRPLTVPQVTLRQDYPWMMASLVALIVLSLPVGGPALISRWEGALLLAGVVAFTIQSARAGKVDVAEVEKLEHAPGGLGKAIGLVALGLAMLVVGGKLCLNGAVALAESIGISQRVISVTIIAAGTSLPELATSIQAARRGHHDIAVGNVIGSNLFNVFCILGLCSLVNPLPVNHGSLAWDYWWMLGVNLLLLPMMYRHGRMGRWSGAILVAVQVVYTVSLLKVSGN